MKIDISANDFCPDNCPAFECEKVTLTDMLGNIVVVFNCSNKEHCRILHDLIKTEESNE